MLALSIRQPFAELILRGIKAVEYRTQPTRIIGRRFYIYAAKSPWSVVSGQLQVKKAENIVVPGQALPEWMIELAEQIKLLPAGIELPRGVIVGSAVIEKVEEVDSGKWIVDREMQPQAKSPSTINYQPSTLFRWHLTDVQRIKRFRKPTNHPQPVWFRPF